MEPKNPLLQSQARATTQYSEPDESSPNACVPSLESKFSVVLPTIPYARLFLIATLCVSCFYPMCLLFNSWILLHIVGLIWVLR